MIPSLEGWPTKPKVARSPHEVRTDPATYSPTQLYIEMLIEVLKKVKICD